MAAPRGRRRRRVVVACLILGAARVTESTGCNCTACGLHLSTWLADACCKYSGVPATLVAFEKAPNWVPRLAEFGACTGASVSVIYAPGGEDGMQEALELDVGVSYWVAGDGLRVEVAGAGVYDGYVVQAPWLPSVVDNLESLSSWIAASPAIEWLDVNSVSRQSVSYDGTVKALPLDTDYIALGWRADVFERYPGLVEVPKTLEDLVATAEFLHGRDHNADGVGDWGICLTPQFNYFYAFMAPLFQRTRAECGAEGVCDGAATGQNPFFDVEDFEPFLVGNAGFAHAARLFHRILRASNCRDDMAVGGSCDRKKAFPTGRCPMVLSLPGTLSNMLLEGGKYAPVPRPAAKEKNATGGDDPGWIVGTADGSYWGRRARFPGSGVVWDKASNTMVPCDASRCPKAEEVLVASNSNNNNNNSNKNKASSSSSPSPSPSLPLLVNFAPYFAEGGEAYAIRRTTAASKKAVLLDLMGWFSTLPFTLLPLSGTYRESHLTAEARDHLVAGGWPQQMADDLHNEVLAHYFADDATEGGNSVQDLLLIGYSDYVNAFERIFLDGFLLDPAYLFQENTNTTEAEFEAALGAATVRLAAAYEAVTEPLGHRQQVGRWRAALNMPPLPPDVDRPAYDQNRLPRWAKAAMVAMATLNLAFALSCAAWTCVFGDRLIVDLSQPRFLYALCLGCGISTLSSVAPLMGRNDRSCQLMIWLYGSGFVLTTATLYTKLEQMDTMLEHALRRQSPVVSAINACVAAPPFAVMALGELAILVPWTILAPLGYDRSCDQRVTTTSAAAAAVADGHHDGACTESVGRCVTTEGPAFVSSLAVYHVLCILAGMYMCHRVRNVPSVLSEGKWVFTGLYSQLQVFVTAAPVLALVHDDYTSFTLFKSLIICASDATTLAMIFVPKMWIVFRYYDFDKQAVTHFVSRSLQISTQRDTVNEELAVKRRSLANQKHLAMVGSSRRHRRTDIPKLTTGLRTLQTSRTQRSDEPHHHYHHHQNKQGSTFFEEEEKSRGVNQKHIPWSVDCSSSSSSSSSWSSPSSSSHLRRSNDPPLSGLEASSSVKSTFNKHLRTLLSLTRPPWVHSTAADNMSATGSGSTKESGGHEHERRSSKNGGLLATTYADLAEVCAPSPILSCAGLFSNDSYFQTASMSERVVDRSERFVSHEIKNRLVMLEDVCTDPVQQEIVAELIELLKKKSVLSKLAEDRYTAEPDVVDLAEVVEKRVARYRDAHRAVARDATEGDAAPAERMLIVDATLVKIILDNLLSNAFKYGDPATPPRISVTLDESQRAARGGDDDGKKAMTSADGKEEEDDDEVLVDLTLEVTNGAGVGHDRLLAMGAVELNRIAHTDGERAHGGYCATTSAGDGFPMSAACARAMGGTLALDLRSDAVVARLTVPRIALFCSSSSTTSCLADPMPTLSPAKTAALGDDMTASLPPARVVNNVGGGARAPVAPIAHHHDSPPNNHKSPKDRPLSSTISALRFALVDDCPVQRKMLTRAVAVAFPSSTLAVVAGTTAASILSFPQDVVDADADIIFVDQNFGFVLETEFGTDVVHKIRRLDRVSNNAASTPRLVFVVSANDSPSDIGLYVAAGADGHVAKNISPVLLRARLVEAAATAARLKHRVTVTKDVARFLSPNSKFKALSLHNLPPQPPPGDTTNECPRAAV